MLKKLLISILLTVPLLVSAQTALYSGGTGLGTSTKGDLLVGTTSKLRYTRLPIGSTGNVLWVTGGQPAWVATSSLNIVTSLPSGCSNQALFFNDLGSFACATGLSWDKTNTKLTATNASSSNITSLLGFYLKGFLSDSTNSTGTLNQVLVSTGTSTQWVSTSTLGFGGGGSGITSLNGLTGASQTFATTTTGTDFSVTSSGTTHTFALPDASASARGVITTGSQTIAGDKTFSGNLSVSANSQLSYPYSTIAGAGTNNNAGMAFRGATSGRYKFGTNYSTSNISAGESATAMGISSIWTEAGSGNHPLISTLAIKPSLVTAGVATVSDTASLYVEGAGTSTVVSGSNYSLWVDNRGGGGKSRIDGSLIVSDDLRDSTNASGTVGQYLLSTGTSTLWTTVSSSGITNLYASTTFASFVYGSSTYVTYPYATSTFPNFSYGSSTYTGITNAYASSTFPSFTYGTSTYAPISGSLNYVTYLYATSTFPNFTYASTTHPSFTYATSTFAPISTTVTNTYASTTFPSFTYASTTHPSFTYSTTTFPSFTYGTSTYAPVSGSTNYVTYVYATTTFPNFTYATTTYPSFTYATTTFPSLTYGSSTYGTYGYGTSTWVSLFNNQTVAGNKTFTGTTTLATTSISFLGIGTSTPIFRMDLVGDTSDNSAYHATRYSADAQPTGIVARKARGTATSPTATLADDYIAILGAKGFGTTAFSTSSVGAFNVRASETFTNGAQGTYLTFETAPTGGFTRTEKMRIMGNGNVGIGTTTPTTLFSVAGTSTLATTTISIGSSTLGFTATNLYFTTARGTTASTTALSASTGATLGALNVTGNSSTTNLSASTGATFARLGVNGITNLVGTSTQATTTIGGFFGIGTTTNADPNGMFPRVSIDLGNTFTSNALTTTGSINSFLQHTISNTSQGASAEAGYTFQNASSTQTSNFGWIGLNGSNFSTTTGYTTGSKGDFVMIGSAQDVYFTNASSTGRMFFQVSGQGIATASTTVMTIAANRMIGIGTTTPQNTLTVATGSIVSSIYDWGTSTSTSMTVDWTKAQTQKMQMANAAYTITFLNGTTSPGQTLTLFICNPTAGTGGAVTFNQVYWPAHTMPTQTTTANNCDHWAFKSELSTSTAIITGNQSPNF